MKELTLVETAIAPIKDLYARIDACRNLKALAAGAEFTPEILVALSKPFSRLTPKQTANLSNFGCLTEEQLTLILQRTSLSELDRHEVHLRYMEVKFYEELDRQRKKGW